MSHTKDDLRELQSKPLEEKSRFLPPGLSSGMKLGVGKCISLTQAEWTARF